jgi:hypothetical protein
MGGTRTVRPSEMSHTKREYNHSGSYEGVRSSIVRARWQIFWMLSVGSTIIGTLIYLSLAAE